MFTELKTLIQNRPLAITVAALSEGRIRVNVIPQTLPKDTEANGKIKYSHKSEVAEVPEAAVKALTTPLSLTGTPEEIDAALPRALLEYSESHGKLQQTLDQAKAQIGEAVKAIDDREKAKAKSKTNTSTKNGEQETKAHDEKKTDEVGLLPLWCKPAAGSASVSDDAAAASSSGAAQPALPSQSTEVSNSCQ
jgi:PRTRC genetic system protein E